MYKFIFYILAAGIILSFPSIGLSQYEEDFLDSPSGEAEEEAGDEYYVEYVYGTLAAIDKNSNKITLNEYDLETDEELNVLYMVDPEVEVENASSWKEIPLGSDIDIEYTVDEDGNKIITYIEVYTEDVPLEE